jgi:hypothetical protein
MRVGEIYLLQLLHERGAGVDFLVGATRVTDRLTDQEKSFLPPVVFADVAFWAFFIAGTPFS